MEFVLWNIYSCFLIQLCLVNNEKVPDIQSTFLNGNLLFTWTKTSKFDHDVIITNNIYTTDLIRINDSRYVVEDVLNFTFVAITIREYRSSDLRDHVDYNKTYKVAVIKCKEGDSRNISWTADYLPAAGIYNIYHTYAGNVSRIIAVDRDSTRSERPLKYMYYGQPYSIDIKFEITNVRRNDAGYYAGGSTKVEASMTSGVILVVQGKPTKPMITGNRTFHTGNPASFICSSHSTSAPDYYKKFPPLSYFWYTNDTRLPGLTKDTYRFIVTKKYKYNRISCSAKETLETERSEDLHIDVLYGPDEKHIWISPQPLPDGRLCVHDGETFGAYNCTADCNPPCIIQWKYKTPTGEFANATSPRLTSQMLPKRQIEEGNVTSFQCVVKGSNGKDDYETKNLDIQCYNWRCSQEISDKKQILLILVGSLGGLLVLMTTAFIIFKITRYAGKRDNSKSEKEKYDGALQGVQTTKKECQNTSKDIVGDNIAQEELYEKYDDAVLEDGGRTTNRSQENRGKITNQEHLFENIKEEQRQNQGYQYEDIKEKESQFYTPLHPI